MPEFLQNIVGKLRALELCTHLSSTLLLLYIFHLKFYSPYFVIVVIVYNKPRNLIFSPIEPPHEKLL